MAASPWEMTTVKLSTTQKSPEREPMLQIRDDGVDAVNEVEAVAGETIYVPGAGVTMSKIGDDLATKSSRYEADDDAGAEEASARERATKV
jgi:hypothetical protein